MGGGGGDSGTSSRVLGSMLTWLSEKTSPVFVVATANDVDSVPPELLRKGRLDEIFFIDLPGKAAREEIFGIHLKAHKQDKSQYDLSVLAAMTMEFSGAEIEQVVISAMYDSFSEGRALTTEDMVRSVNVTTPLSRSMASKFDRLRDWAKGKARHAATMSDITTTTAHSLSDVN